MLEIKKRMFRKTCLVNNKRILKYVDFASKVFCKFLKFASLVINAIFFKHQIKLVKLSKEMKYFSNGIEFKYVLHSQTLNIKQSIYFMGY